MWSSSSTNSCQRCEASNQACVIDENGRSRETSSPSQASIIRETVQQVISPKGDSEIESRQKSPGIAIPQNDESLQGPSHESASLDGELEGAILLVEDPGRTQYTGLRSNESFLLGVRDVLQANSEKAANNGEGLSNLDVRFSFLYFLSNTHTSLEKSRSQDSSNLPE